MRLSFRLKCLVVIVAIAVAGLAQTMNGQARRSAGEALSIVLGRPTNHSVVLNILSPEAVEAFVEYGTKSGTYDDQTEVVSLAPREPAVIEIEQALPNTRYFYRLLVRAHGAIDFSPQTQGTFHTQRAPGSAFTFALQGDSHPERPGKMYDQELYTTTMMNAAKDRPDFYLALGDDFSIERLIERKAATEANVGEVYAAQRPFLGLVGSSAPVYLVNGNHEQAARYLLDGTGNDPAIQAARARVKYYALPAPDGFYTGDAEPVEHAGLLRDYYAWTWGDALFVVIDPYWHSTSPVDNEAGTPRKGGGKKRGRGELRLPENEGGIVSEKGSGKKRDLWEITLGDMQYRWLKTTLTRSKARWKFVFCHHVLGTGRGGVEQAGLYEWGGRDRNGQYRFEEKRPGWPLPIHQLFVKTGVTILFQGHDHLFARQELDGIIYQSCPTPADQTYQAFNREAYCSGDILPNSGHMRVRVSPTHVEVEYVRAFLPADVQEGRENGSVAFRYVIPAR